MIPWLEVSETINFPPVSHVLSDPDGLLCAGADLAPKTLISAYCQGIFPWFSAQDPILWWSPAERCVIYPDQIHISRSMQKVLKKNTYSVGFTNRFKEVISACAAPRKDDSGTWITSEMITAYSTLFDMGVAHAVGLFDGKHLIGGLYGLSIGRVFFAESMFSAVPNASKIVLIWLARELQKSNYLFIECQNESPHLNAMGATMIKRKDYLDYLKQACFEKPSKECGK